MIPAEICDYHFHAGIDECDCHTEPYSAGSSSNKSDLPFDILHGSILLRVNNEFTS